MKKIAISALVLAAASVAAPAMAQSYGPQPHRNDRGYEQNHRGPNYEQSRGWESIAQRKYNLDRRIDQGQRNRQLSLREANSLKAQLNQLVALERSYMRGGLTRAERNELDRRYDRLSAQVRVERRDHNGRRH